MSWQEDERVLRDCEEAFITADLDGKGHLTKYDYKVAILHLFGYKPSKYEVQAVWRENGEPGNGLVKEQFVSIASQRLKKLDRETLARQVFLTFDINCKGFLEQEDFIRAVQTVTPHLATTNQIAGLFSEVDWNGDGRVSYGDFELMMRPIKR